MARYGKRYGNFRKKFSGYRIKARGYYKKSGLSLSTEFLAGAVVGLTNYDAKIPAELKILAACAPVKGFGRIKAFAQGMLLGDVIQARTGINIMGGGTISTNGGW